jgi:hypothetical protein
MIITQNIPIGFQLYIVAYLILMLFAIILITKNRKRYGFLTKEYFQFIFARPRIIIYILGTLALVLPVKSLNYHSWDYPIAIFQPITAYLTAPWAVSIFNKMATGKAKLSEAYVALCMMLFTGSWSVEIYLLIRDGYYMPDWLINIPIGICCYAFVGILWNIPWNNDKVQLVN